MIDFCHLHSHTQYSLLDGASDIKTLMKKAKADGQSAVAITDHGNMFGVFKFVKEANAKDIKPIIGCEFYVSEDRHVKSFEKSRGLKDVPSIDAGQKYYRLSKSDKTLLSRIYRRSIWQVPKNR